MTEKEDRIKLLEEKIESLTTKLNEVISCLEENEIFRKTSVEYIMEEDEEQEEPEIEEPEDGE